MRNYVTMNDALKSYPKSRMHISLSLRKRNAITTARRYAITDIYKPNYINVVFTDSITALRRGDEEPDECAEKSPIHIDHYSSRDRIKKCNM